jgi:hypothetical protein
MMQYMHIESNNCTGPGYYNLDKVMATGEKDVFSSTSNLKYKPVGSFEPYRRSMSRSKFAISKSSFNL